MTPLGGTLHGFQQRIWNNNTHAGNFCRSSLFALRSPPSALRSLRSAGRRWPLLKVTMQSASAVEANSSKESSSGSTDNGRQRSIFAWQIETATRSSRRVPTSCKLARRGTTSRKRTSSYSSTTGADKWRRRPSDLRTFCNIACDAPVLERIAATTTFVSTTIFIWSHRGPSWLG